MSEAKGPRTIDQKIRSAHEWLFEADEMAEKILAESKAPDFHLRRWDELAWHLRCTRLAVGRAQSHARRLARRQLERKGFR